MLHSEISIVFATGKIGKLTCRLADFTYYFFTIYASLFCRADYWKEIGNSEYVGYGGGRLADRVEQLLRIDDTTGETEIPLRKHTDTANQWQADLYLQHHSALEWCCGHPNVIEAA